jgi:hypothetical protein
MAEVRTKGARAAKYDFSLIARIVLLQIGAIIVAAAPQKTTSPLEDLVSQSSYVFIGTVLKLNAVTVASMSASNRMVVVLVNEVLYSRIAVPELTGKEITVELQVPKSVKIGQRIAFFTSSGEFGKTVTVREMGHLDGADSVANLRQRVTGIVQQQTEESVKRRIASAELVVMGKLVNIEPADVPGPGTREDPEWYEAEIEVQTVEKGQFPGKRLSVLMARSLDVKPVQRLTLTRDKGSRLTKEQEGIWILHRNEVPRLGISDRYTAADPIDFQAKDRLARIRQLIKGAV